MEQESETLEFKSSFGEWKEAPPPIRRDEAILDWLRENPEGTLAALARHLGIRTDSVKEYVEKLKREPRLRREGATRNGRWIVAHRRGTASLPRSPR